MAGPGEHGGAALADRIEVRVQRVGELRLDLDVADLAGAVARLQVVDFGRVRVERVVVDEHRIALDRARNVGAHALRIGVHLPDLLDHRRRRVGQMDRVAEALAHLLVAVEARAGAANVVSSGCGSTSTSAPKKLLKRRTTSRDELEVRDLILADRHEARVVHRDVGGLQQRIAEEADRRQVLVLQVLLLLLVGRHALEPRHRHDHRQQQVQLGVLGHERLDEERALLRIEARRRSSRRRCRRRTSSAGSCRRSRSSARASRRRSRSSRTAPAAAPSC